MRKSGILHENTTNILENLIKFKIYFKKSEQKFLLFQIKMIIFPIKYSHFFTRKSGIPIKKVGII